jgi:Tfp pilus assembly protein FimT
MKRRKRNRITGFTFIEILLVVGIIGIMILVSYPSIQNTMKTRQLENSTREILTTLQSAKFQAVKQKLSYRVRFDNTPGYWVYLLEREVEVDDWRPIPGAVRRTIPESFVVTINLPDQTVVYSSLGMVKNYSTTQHSISLQNPNLSQVSQPNTRTVNIFAGGSVQYVK